MERDINNINGFLSNIQMQSKKLADAVKHLEHEDYGVQNYINKVQKLSLQNLDVLNEMQRQLFFLSNEHKNFDIKKERENRRRKK